MLIGDFMTHSLVGSFSFGMLLLGLLIMLVCRPARRVIRPQQYGSGSAKIFACRNYAAADTSKRRDFGESGPYGWLWIDTCCIDKSSSAELTKSIKSMYRWYEKAGVCYAYLSDVSGSRSLVSPIP